MPKHKLDPTFCLVAQCKAGSRKTTFWDTQISGFILECRSSGGKTYALRYPDLDGTQRQYKIGRFEDIKFKDAKEVARRLRSQVVLDGNPAAEKAERKAVPTFGEVAVQHLAHAKTYQRRYDGTESNMRCHILPRWGKTRLTDIKSQDISRWLSEKESSGLKPATVDKIRVIASRTFELGRKWGIPGAENNPFRGIPRPKYNNARDVFLTAHQAQNLVAAAEKSPNKQLKPAIQLFLYTGVRKAELLKAQWQHIDLERRVWHIPMTKNGKNRYVPLSKPAIDVLSALPRFENCPYVLPNPDTRKPFVSLKRAWDTVRVEAGLPHVRIHDLRHSAASFMINAGIDLYAVGKVLGHTDVASTMRYSHLANETLMAAVEAGAARMNGDSHGVQ